MSENPLTADSRASWDRLIGAVTPASMLVAIRGLMSGALAARLDAEDVWQETLCMAWRDRAQLEWRGVGAFRRWLLEIARNRVRDLSDHETAAKRGGGRERAFGRNESHEPGDYAGPVATTTPSRVLANREIAARLQSALDAVPDEWRDVVRLRLFEDLTMEAVAERVGIGVEAARYRFRQGLERYRTATRQLRCSRSGTNGTPALAAAPGKLPWIGTTFTARIDSLPPSTPLTPSHMLLGSSSPPPICLGFLCRPTCCLLTSIAQSYNLTVTGGVATWNLSVPPNPALLGGKFYNQTLTLDFGSGCVAAMSNAAEATIGTR